MLRENAVLIFKNSDLKRSPKLALAAFLVACSFFWTGCNGITQSSAASSSTSPQPLSMQTVLPSASVGSTYHQVLSVRQGQTPDNVVVTHGELPPGLALNSSTGSISGIPTLAGTFTFTITSTSVPTVGMIVERGSVTSSVGAYTMAVVPSVKSVAVQISPADPSIGAGGKVQFSAGVSNTSNTAVTWSASAGAISSNGLFTAPSSGSATSITITASSVAETAARASTAVTITSVSPTLAINTSSVPSAVVATPYSATLTATGGQPPYQWSLVSGSLPAGLQLGASKGTLSGAATRSGTFAFSVKVTDASSRTAEQSLSLSVTSAQACGPPVYCSRTDTDIVQLPAAPPNVGNLSGANTIVTDPDFGNRIVRITDANTNPDAAYKNRTLDSTASGSADDNLWNIDSTLLIVQDTGSAGYPFTFNPSTLQAARMYISSFPATNGLMLPNGGIWSRVSPNVLYTNAGTAISKYDFTDRSNAPSPQLVYDFTSSPNCLPAGFTETWRTTGGVSSDDTVFAMGYSNGGSQGTGIYAVAYKVGSGCSILNTQTGQVGGDWGAKGTINIADRWTVHNVKLSKDGNWAIVSKTNCTTSSCSAPYFWQIGTTNVISCGEGGYCGGHFTEGYTHWVNNDNTPLSNQVVRLFAQPSSATALTHVFPPGITGNLDQHQSWNNVDPADSVPFISSTWSPTTPFPAPWYNEIIAVAADGSGTTWRFAHSFNTTKSLNFSTQYAIGSVSQDGKFFLFSSDWMGKLGSESGTPTCTIGTDCRGDAFVLELR